MAALAAMKSPRRVVIGADEGNASGTTVPIRGRLRFLVRMIPEPK
jgi:hypothetical protein